MSRTSRLAGSLLAAALAFAQPVAAKTLIFCSEGSPENFNPAVANTGTSYEASRPIYNHLVEFRPGSLDLVPSLAESWQISPDGKTYTFQLRRNVKWQANSYFKPTRDFNADDVMFSFTRMWKANNPYHNVSGGHYAYFEALGLSKLLQSMDKLDDYTVRFVLARPEAPFLADLAIDFAVITSAEYADAMLRAGTPERLDHEPIGTGPFAFVAYQKDATIRYRRFEEYWGNRQKLDGLVYAITPDPSVRLAKLRSGECHVMVFPSPSDIPAIAADPSLKLAQREGLNVGLLSLNVTKKPLDDVRVRQALALATNKPELIRLIYLEEAVPAKNPLPPTLAAYNDDIKDYPYDLDRARALLKEAGLEGGFDAEMWYMPVQRPYNPSGQRLAQAMQADFAKIGVRTKLLTYEFGEYLKRVYVGEHTIAQTGWAGDNGDPDNFLNVLLSCAAVGTSNAARWCDKDFDALIEEARSSNAPQRRIELYRHAQMIVHDQVPVIPIAHAIGYVAMRKEVLNYRMSPLNRRQFDDVDLQE
jgi:dipeptide transport system substrate-binding protein